MAVELAISGTAPLGVTLPTMVGVHVVIGIGEALITMAALGFIAVTRSDLLYTARTAAPRGA
jgi:cobalt/nickel transport system permease protein